MGRGNKPTADGVRQLVGADNVDSRRIQLMVTVELSIFMEPHGGQGGFPNQFQCKHLLFCVPVPLDGPPLPFFEGGGPQKDRALWIGGTARRSHFYWPDLLHCLMVSL